MAIHMKDIYIYEPRKQGEENKNFVEIGKCDSQEALRKVQTVINAHDELVEELTRCWNFIQWNKEGMQEASKRVEDLLARAKGNK